MIFCFLNNSSLCDFKLFLRFFFFFFLRWPVFLQTSLFWWKASQWLVDLLSNFLFYDWYINMFVTSLGHKRKLILYSTWKHENVISLYWTFEYWTKNVAESRPLIVHFHNLTKIKYGLRKKILIKLLEVAWTGNL